MIKEIEIDHLETLLKLNSDKIVALGNALSDPNYPDTGTDYEETLYELAKERYRLTEWMYHLKRKYV
jgi:hypothetical protein